MAKFIKVNRDSPVYAAQEIIINSEFISCVVTNDDGKTLIYEQGDDTPFQVIESFEEVCKMLGYSE